MIITDEMVERAAKALCHRVRCVTPGNNIWGMVEDSAKERYRQWARAALEAALSGEKDGQTKTGQVGLAGTSDA